jgi:hypothetical protein
MNFKIFFAATVVIFSSSFADELENSHRRGHWVAPLDYFLGRSDHDPFAGKPEFSTPEEFRALIRGDDSEIFWISTPPNELRDNRRARFALIEERVTTNDPFANSDENNVTTHFFLSVQRDFIEGKFKETQRYGVSHKQAEALKLLGRFMTAEVGYPLEGQSSRLTGPSFIFGSKQKSGNWAHGGGAMPAGNKLVNVVCLLNRLPSSRPERMLAQEIADILQWIETCIRHGCAELVKEAADAKKAALKVESKSEEKESAQDKVEEQPK